MGKFRLVLMIFISAFSAFSLLAKDRSFLIPPPPRTELSLEISDEELNFNFEINGEIFQKEVKNNISLIAVPYTYSFNYFTQEGYGETDQFKISAAELNGGMFLEGDGPGDLYPEFTVSFAEYESNNNNSINSFLSTKEFSAVALNLSLSSKIQAGIGEIIFNISGLTKALIDAQIEVKDSNERFDFNGFSFAGSAMVGYNFRYKGHEFPCKAEVRKQLFQDVGKHGRAQVIYTRYSCSANVNQYIGFSVAHDETRTEYENGSFLKNEVYKRDFYIELVSKF